MALGANDPWILHVARNICLVLLSLVFLPYSLVACIATFALGSADAARARSSDESSNVKRILVTGVGMTKGLYIARTMHLGGCIVVGADFGKNGSLYCGRFSRAVRRFYALKDPSRLGSQAYIDHVVEIVKSENIDLWISCSGVATAIEDARLARVIEQFTRCKAFQLDEHAVSILDDKLRFMQKTSDLGLANVEWYPLRSAKDISKVMNSIHGSNNVRERTSYIVKSAGMDDISRGAIPILSSENTVNMRKVLEQLDFGEGRTWIVQEFVDSEEEYCTHAVIANGSVKAFTACRSESILMHYKQLDPKSILFEKMLKFTQSYVDGLGKETNLLTGHVSFDFLIRYRQNEGGFIGTLAPIECNPRCHTAVVLFRGREESLAECYLEVLGGESKAGILIAEDTEGVGHYWIAHDIVAMLIAPLLALLQEPSGLRLKNLIRKSLDALGHFLTWRDPTFEWWDPWPWFILYHVYWPVELILATVNGVRWKQLNVSTTKMFKC